jgi:hypothetical protein
VRDVEIGEVGSEEKVVCLNGGTKRQWASAPEAEEKLRNVTGALKEKSFLAQSGRLDIPHTVEHGEQSAVFQNPGPVISRR